ncbi:hypothetical protein ISCGN_003202 [Ixodes scapularis]
MWNHLRVRPMACRDRSAKARLSALKAPPPRTDHRYRSQMVCTTKEARQCPARTNPMRQPHYQWLPDAGRFQQYQLIARQPRRLTPMSLTLSGARRLLLDKMDRSAELLVARLLKGIPTPPKELT